MKTEKTIKAKTPTASAKAAPKVPASIGLEAAPRRESTMKVAAPEAPTAQATPAKAAPRQEITGDLIAARAYIIWEQQGRPQGSDLANWLLAESQLKQEQSFTA